jgi:hypothetical protein
MEQWREVWNTEEKEEECEAKVLEVVAIEAVESEVREESNIS